MTAKPLKLETRPYLELVATQPCSRDSEPIELRPSARTLSARPALTMAGVTSGLQLVLAARRAARFSGPSD